jgi:hypothetical protein
VRYAEDESVLDESFESGNEIVYIEKAVHADSEEALLKDPYVFLSAPLSGDTETWPAVHGPGIYAKISLHCFRCAAGGAKSVRSRFNRADAVKWIADNYPDAETHILEHLKS